MKHRTALVLSLFLAVTYHQNIKPILDAHCIECHSAGNDLDLSSFPFQSATMSDEAAIVDKMLAKAGASPAVMPPGNRPKLTSDELEVVQQWREHGLEP